MFRLDGRSSRLRPLLHAGEPLPVPAQVGRPVLGVVRMPASQRTLFEDGLWITGALLGSAGIALPGLQLDTALVLELNAAD